MNEKQVVERVRKEVKRAGSIRALAREWNVTSAYLSFILSGRRSPGPKVLHMLGLKRVESITYTAR